MKKETWTPPDPAQKKLVAYAVVAIFIGVMAVLGVRSVSGPQLFPGDRQESIACKLCQSAGKQGNKRCRLCLDTGKVKVIIPGPEHPVDVRGSVRQAQAFRDQAEADEVAAKESAEVTLKPVRGAVANAKLSFIKSGKTITIEGKATGRFRCNLPPGSYQVKVSAAGYQDLQQSFEIPVRKQPVWPTRPGLDFDEEKLRPVFLLQGK